MNNLQDKPWYAHLTVAVVVKQQDRYLLVEEIAEQGKPVLNQPAGHLEPHEQLEHAAVREALEETSLSVELIEQFYVYSDPDRDPRQHTLSVVFIASAIGEPKAADDAKNLQLFELWNLPKQLCFDHDRILKDYCHYRRYGQRPRI